MNHLEQRLRDADPLDGQMPEPRGFPFAAGDPGVTVAYGGASGRLSPRRLGAFATAVAATLLIVFVVANVLGGSTKRRLAAPAALTSPTLAVKAQIEAWGHDDFAGVCAAYSETQLARITDHGQSQCSEVLAAGGSEVERDRHRFTNATAVELLHATHFAVVRVMSSGGQSFDVPVLREDGGWRVGAYCEPECSEHPPPPPSNKDITVNTTAVGSTETAPPNPNPSAADRHPVAAVPDDVPVQALRNDGVGELSPAFRSALADAHDSTVNADLARLLIDDGTVMIAAAPTRDGLCLAAHTKPDHALAGVGCMSADQINNGGAYTFNPCWGGDPKAINVVGIAPDGVKDVALLRAGRVIKSAPVTNNAFRIVGQDIDGIRVGDSDSALSTDGIC